MTYEECDNIVSSNKYIRKYNIMHIYNGSSIHYIYPTTVHGMWSEWIDGACSKTCEYGVRTRYRSCVGPYCGGHPCDGIQELTEGCYERTCKGM